jgi:hypothetical protein
MSALFVDAVLLKKMEAGLVRDQKLSRGGHMKMRLSPGCHRVIRDAVELRLREILNGGIKYRNHRMESDKKETPSVLRDGSENAAASSLLLVSAGQGNKKRKQFWDFVDANSAEMHKWTKEFENDIAQNSQLCKKAKRAGLTTFINHSHSLDEQALRVFVLKRGEDDPKYREKKNTNGLFPEQHFSSGIAIKSLLEKKQQTVNVEDLKAFLRQRPRVNVLGAGMRTPS